MLAYGETKGCFEMPSTSKKPTEEIDCPDILPLAHQESQKVDSFAMTNQSPLIHPDVTGTRRYIMGTRMQMRDSGKSHKKPTCAFHDLAKSKQGSLINSMNQEAMQVTRHGVNLVSIFTYFIIFWKKKFYFKFKHWFFYSINFNIKRGFPHNLELDTFINRHDWHPDKQEV